MEVYWAGGGGASGQLGPCTSEGAGSVGESAPTPGSMVASLHGSCLSGRVGETSGPLGTEGGANYTAEVSAVTSHGAISVTPGVVPHNHHTTATSQLDVGPGAQASTVAAGDAR